MLDITLKMIPEMESQPAGQHGYSSPKRASSSPRAHSSPRARSSSRARSKSKTEGSEAAMQQFVHSHMMNILQPFIEQIGCIEEALENLKGGLSETVAGAAQHQIQIEAHNNKLSELDCGLAKLNAHLEATREELSRTDRSLTELAADAGHRKIGLAHIEEKLQTVEASVSGLQSAQADSCSDISKLQRSQQDIEKKLSEHVETRLNNIHRFCKDLSTQQADLTESFRPLKALGESNQQALKQLSSAVDKKHAQDYETFQCLNQHAKGFEAKLGLLSGDLQRQGESMKSHDKEFQRLRTEIAPCVTQLHKAHANDSEALLSLKEYARRLGKAEKDVSQLRGDSAAGFHKIESFFRDIQDKADKNNSDIVDLRNTHEGNARLLHSCGQRVTDLECEHLKLSKRSDSIQVDVQGLAFWQNGATEKLEAHASELARLQTEMQASKKTLEATDIDVESLRKELDTTQKSHSRFESRLDTHQKYFSGFGKGLQETHRKVAGDSGHMPAKAGTVLASMMLPAVPVTPRSSSGLSPRRRKPTVQMCEER